jgi:hypothetical protein
VQLLPGGLRQAGAIDDPTRRLGVVRLAARHRRCFFPDARFETSRHARASMRDRVTWVTAFFRQMRNALNRPMQTVRLNRINDGRRR